MEKPTQKRIEVVLKRKRDDISGVEEDPMATTTDILPLLELEQQQLRSNEPVTFQGVEFFMLNL